MVMNIIIINESRALAVSRRKKLHEIRLTAGQGKEEEEDEPFISLLGHDNHAVCVCV